MMDKNAIGLAAEPQFSPSVVRVDIYKNAIQEHKQALLSLNRRYTMISYLRLLVFLIGVGAAYVTFPINVLLGIFVGFIFLVLFVRLILFHNQLADKRTHVNNVIEVHELEIDIAERKWKEKKDGKEYIQPEHAYAFDLDIFGPASIYQYILRSSTKEGQDKLANWLMHPLLTPQKIVQRQKAVMQISEHQDWALNFQATGKRIDATKEDLTALQDWIEEPPFYLTHPYYKTLMWVLPAIFLLTALIALLKLIPAFTPSLAGFPSAIPILLFIFHLFIVRSRIPHTGRQHALLGKRSNLLNIYSQLLEQIEEAPMKEGYWGQLKERLKVKTIHSSEAIRQLSGIWYFLDQRLNVVMGILLNGSILWDLQQVYKLEKWKANYKEALPDWLEVVAESDGLISLGRFQYNHPEFVVPTLSETSSSFYVDAKQLGHPLLDPSSRVDNDIAIYQGEFLLVTGANMAGKSTFLRTVGVNMILAMNGLPVCAKAYAFAPIPIFTSIRATDDLEARASYFYAELSRLKRLIDQLAERPIFVIVDEMLRGTNSRDKQTGSRRFIEKMLSLKGTGIVATHDLSLGELAQIYPEKVHNKRFEVEIRNDQLSFDYQLQDGVSQNLNATFLMEQMGIM